MVTKSDRSRILHAIKDESIHKYSSTLILYLPKSMPCVMFTNSSPGSILIWNTPFFILYANYPTIFLEVPNNKPIFLILRAKTVVDKIIRELSPYSLVPSKFFPLNRLDLRISDSRSEQLSHPYLTNFYDMPKYVPSLVFDHQPRHSLPRRY